MDACIKTIIPLFRGVIAKILFSLVPSRHGLALDDQICLLVVGCAMLRVCHMQTKRSSLITIATAILTHVLPHLWIVKLHDGESCVLLHELPSIATRRHVNRHCRPAMSKVVSDTTPPYSHGITLINVARAKDEILGKPSEAVVSKLLLYVESSQLICNFFFFNVLCSFLRTA